jgi:hypothetical protein
MTPTFQINPGATGIWRGLPVTAHAFSKFPDGDMVYCTVVIGGVVRAYWLDYDQVCFDSENVN